MREGILANYIRASIRSDLAVLQNALEQPELWENSYMALEALARVREALALLCQDDDPASMR